MASPYLSYQLNSKLVVVQENGYRWGDSTNKIEITLSNPRRLLLTGKIVWHWPE